MDSFFIKDLKSINMHIRCPYCGLTGFKQDCTCNYCNNKNQMLEGDIEEINNIISKADYENYKLYDYIRFYCILKVFNISLDNINISNFCKRNKVDLIVERYQVRKNNEMMAMKNISFEDVEILQFLYSNNLLDNTILFNDFVLKKVLLGEKISDYNTFKSFIDTFVCSLLKTFWDNPRCNFFDGDKNNKFIYGTYNMNIININEKIVKEFYEDGDFTALITIFHEFEHAIQRYFIKNFGEFIKNINDSYLLLDLIKITKEMVVFEKDQSFYKDNYNVLAYEADAEYFGNWQFLQLLDNLGLKIYGDSHKFILEEMKKQRLIFQCEERILNGKKVTLDEAFLQYISPFDLEYYPQLKLEYCVDNMVVRPKNSLELSNDYEFVNSGDYKYKKIFVSTIDSLIEKRKKIEMVSRSR